MIVYRSNTIPCIYSNLSFIRHHQNAGIGFVDCPEDLDLIEKLKKIMRNELCLSSLEGPAYFYIAADIPDIVMNLKGETYKEYTYKRYYYKIYDITSLVNEQLPYEAIEIKNSGLNMDRILKIFDNTSCYKYLKNTINLYDYSENDNYKGVDISDVIIKKLMRIEKRTIASFNL